MVVILFLFYFIFHQPILADEQADLLKQDEILTIKLLDLAKTKDSLGKELKIIDINYSQTELKIKQTELSIKILTQEIDILNQDIAKLDNSINQTTLYLLERIKQSYRLSKKMPPYAFIFSHTFNDYLNQHKYISIVQLNNRQNIEKDETMQQIKKNKKHELSDKQKQLTILGQNLTVQKTSLQSQKTAKNRLLAITNNDEIIYQKRLTEAQNQLIALKNFSSSAGGDSCLSTTPGIGNDGNFYSQRDPGWCSRRMGNSGDTIGAVGCYISSISMVYKKIGSNMTPLIYAQDSSNFFSTTAYAVNPSPPSGYIYRKVAYSSSTVDNEFSAGRYIIAELKMGSGQHFVVLISGSKGNYKMHDPWYGPDLDLTTHYSTSQIQSLRLITK